MSDKRKIAGSPFYAEYQQAMELRRARGEQAASFLRYMDEQLALARSRQGAGQMIVERRQQALWQAMEALKKACGDDYQLMGDPQGEPVCVVNGNMLTLTP